MPVNVLKLLQPALRRIGLCLTLSLTVLVSMSTVQAQTLRTAAQSGAAFKFGSVTSARPGLCREVAQRLEQLDPELHFRGLSFEAPLRRIELLLERGQIDVFFCLLDTPERRQRFSYLPQPIYRVRHVVVVRVDDSRRPSNLRELAELGRESPVLVAQGSVLARTLAQAKVPFSEAASSDLAALRMLSLGRAAAVYGQDLNLLPLLKLPELAGKVKLLEASFVDDQQYVVVGHHVPRATADRIAAALAQLERKGALRELQDKYYRQP